VVSALLLAGFLLAGEEPTAGAVRVEGGGACPSPADVAQRLAPLLPPAAPDRAARRAVLSREGRELRVELREADGAVLAHRHLGAAPCGDLAAAAAVVIATWEVELRGRGVLGLWPESAQPRPAAPPAPPPPPAVRAAPPSVPSRIELAIGAAALGGAGASGGVAAGALVEARGRRPGGILGLTLALLWQGERSLPLAGGSVAWRRTAVVLGPSLRRPLGARGVAVEADAGVVAAALLLRGAGFSRDAVLAVFDPGATVSARVSVRAGSLIPWIGAGIWAWPVTHETAVQGATGAGTRDLPRGEVFISLGLALGVRP